MGRKYLKEDEFHIHPHVREAYQNYNGDPEEFKKALGRGKDSRNTDHDEEMLETARERSQNPLFRWPLGKRK